jgi:hypothetical protein
MSEFNELLDKVLREDGQVEPLAGLEERVIARVRLSVGQRSKRLMVWWCAAAVLPVCVVALLLWPRSVPQRKSAGANVSIEHPRVAPVEVVSKVVLPKRERNGQVRRKMTGVAATIPASAQSTALPKLDVFPSPSPSTEQMQALSEIAQRDPREIMPDQTEGEPEKKQPAALKVEPITIARIEIEPLYPLPDANAKKVEGR